MTSEPHKPTWTPSFVLMPQVGVAGTYLATLALTPGQNVHWDLLPLIQEILGSPELAPLSPPQGTLLGAGQPEHLEGVAIWDLPPGLAWVEKEAVASPADIKRLF